MQNKYFLLVINLLLFSCNDKEKKINEFSLCNNDNVIHFHHKELILSFAGNTNKIDVKKIKILHIRNNQIIPALSYSKLRDNKIDFVDLPSLRTIDSLKIILNDKESIYLHNFKNGPDYGGQKFLGCTFQTYMLNGVEKGISDHSKIYIYLN
ncbi:hypothetical protein [Flavobacterium oreochromis]|nr:hypothetical protein [Flavobacterium oreochromis]OWP74362.1 hypothetical protein BWK62_14535 [Flavobacterium oreochromis]OWP76892.1 hypothetical protein BWG23_06550 [Flavobacterium oreochromis]